MASYGRFTALMIKLRVAGAAEHRRQTPSGLYGDDSAN